MNTNKFKKMPKSYTYNDVKTIFETNNCVLVSKNYKNTLDNLEYIAACGHNHKISLKLFLRKKHKVCINCSSNVRNQTKLQPITKYNFNKVKELMEKKFEMTMKYRNDFLPENYNKTLMCWDCKESKPFRLFPYRVQYKDNKEKRCKNCINSNHKSRCKNHSIGQIITSLLTTAKHSCMKREKKFRFEAAILDITTDYIKELVEKQQNKCAYSGVQFIWEYGSNHKPSLDRIDSSKGYIKGNVHLVTTIVNQAKSDLIETDFLKMIKSIYETKNLHELQ
jgi:hypothetical protein